MEKRKLLSLVTIFNALKRKINITAPNASKVKIRIFIVFSMLLATRIDFENKKMYIYHVVRV